MNLHEYFRGDGHPRSHPLELPPSVAHDLDDAAGYSPTAPVKAAVNVALNLGLPLLVTGDPGTGKSVLGKAVAYELGLQFIEFVAKSNTSANDLLYRFDAVGHFRDAQIRALETGSKRLTMQDGGISENSELEGPGFSKGPKPLLAPYIRFEALGRAIAITYKANDTIIDAVWDTEATIRQGAWTPSAELGL
jgi:hypothetical protein